MMYDHYDDTPRKEEYCPLPCRMRRVKPTMGPEASLKGGHLRCNLKDEKEPLRGQQTLCGLRLPLLSPGALKAIIRASISS